MRGDIRWRFHFRKRRVRCAEIVPEAGGGASRSVFVLLFIRFSASASGCVLSPSLARGEPIRGRSRCPLETTPTGRPDLRAYFVKGDRPNRAALRCRKNNMKTDTKNSNAFRAPSHPEQLSTDTNPRKLYEVEVHRHDYLTTTIGVWAKSKREAKAKAEDRAEYMKYREWCVFECDIYAFDVEQMKKGGRHE